MQVVFLYINGKFKASHYNSESPEFIINSWSGYISNYLAQLQNEWNFINIRQDGNAKEDLFYHKNNFVTLIYPYLNLDFFGLLNKSMNDKVFELLSQNNAILHCFHTHSLLSYYIVWKYRKFPIVLTNYGHTPPFYIFKTEKKITKKIKLWILYKMEKFVYRNVKLFTPSGVVQREYLNRIYPNLRVASFDHYGIDFQLFKPVSKEEARVALYFPKDANILLYVGHLYELKGVDAILDSYKVLKTENANLILVLIGASESDPLYKPALESGAKIYPRLSHDELKVHYSAADIYLLPNFKSIEFVKFGGIGTAPLEALACNTPVISTHLIHFPVKDLPYVGLIPKDETDLTNCITEILDNKEKYINCREIVRKHYDRETIAETLVEEYKRVIHET